MKRRFPCAPATPATPATPAAPVPWIEPFEPRLLFAAGELDTAFGVGGYATLRGQAGDQVLDVQSANGKTYIGVVHFGVVPGGGVDGTDTTVADRFRVVRIGPTGKVERVLDSVSSDLGRGFDSYGGFAVQPNGKLLVSGNRYPYGGGLVRYNADGSYDPTFNGGGASALAINRPTAPLVLPDGRIVVGGTFGVDSTYDRQRFALARLDRSGNFDRTFAGNGVAVLPDVPGYVTKLAAAPGGKLIVGGQWEDYDTDTGATIVRLNADGSLDRNWPGGGSGARGRVRCPGRHRCTAGFEGRAQRRRLLLDQRLRAERLRRTAPRLRRRQAGGGVRAVRHPLVFLSGPRPRGGYRQ